MKHGTAVPLRSPSWELLNEMFSLPTSQDTKADQKADQKPEPEKKVPNPLFSDDDDDLDWLQ